MVKIKNYKYISSGLIILLVTLILLAGCGVSQSDYDNLKAQKTALETEKQILQNNNDNLQAENKDLQSEKSTLAAENQALKEENDSLNNECDSLKSNLEQIQADKDTLQENCDLVNKELTEIKKAYPPRDFSSRRELEDWLMLNDVSEKPDTTDAESWIGRALEIQEDALLDGYVINFDYDYSEVPEGYIVFCTTIINGYIWYWNPETDEITQDTSLLPVK